LRYFFLFLVLLSHLHAAEPSSTAIQTKKSDSCEHYVDNTAENLKLLFQEKNYGECYDSALSAHAFDDPLIQCYLSQCAQKLGYDNMAIGALERILLLQPENVEAILELSKIYNRLGLTKQRDLVAASLKAYQLTPIQRTELATLLATKEQKLAVFSASISVGGGYDSNLNILPTEDEVESAYARVSLEMSFAHDLIKKGGWFLNGNFNYQHQSNESTHFFDYDFLSASAGLGYKMKGLSITVPLYYRRLFYLDTDLVQEYGLRPSVDIILSKSFILNANGTLAKREFLSPAEEGKNFESYGGGMGGVWLFEGDFIYLSGKYKSFTETKNQPTIFTAKYNYILSVGGNYSLNKMLRIRFRYRFRDDHFDDFYEADNKRHDNNHAMTLGFDIIMSEHWRIIPLYRYAANLSNYDSATYHKQVTELSLQYNY